jgi:hypothetical protein
MSVKHKPGTDFDVAAFLEVIDKARAGRSYRSVAATAGVSASSFTAMAQGRSPDAVTLGRLLEWLTGERPFWMCATP